MTTRTTSRGDDFDVVVALNYYAPYVSGVTETARVWAEGLASRGVRVLVVAGRHDSDLPKRETLNGVEVRRTTVASRIGKGILSPTFVPTVLHYARRARLLHLHLPLLEAGDIATILRGRAPLLSTYHCDVSLPSGLLNRVQVTALDRSHRLALRRSDLVSVSSEDYAYSSRLWPVIRSRHVVISPPSQLRAEGRPTFRNGPGMHVGFLGRLVVEKGVEYLVEGFRALSDPDARLLVGGEFAKVAGGSVVESIRRSIGNDPRIQLLGFIPDSALADFFASLDVFALPSVNSLEAFGIVQVEAMMAGVPVLATDRPGVRTIVNSTQFGVIVPPRDPEAIRDALARMRATDVDRVAGAARARAAYGPETVIDQYERVITPFLGDLQRLT